MIDRSKAKNIFEFLVTTVRDKPFQLVKHYDEVPDSKKEFPMMGQVKKDGVFAAVAIVGYTAMIFGRTGKRLSNVELQEQDFFQCMVEQTLPEFPQGVFITELCSDECSLEELSGIVNPNRTKPLTPEQEAIKKNMYMCFHDYVSLFEFIRGESDMTYIKREERLLRYVPEKQVIKSYLIYNEQDLNEFTEICVNAGEEGAVFKNPLAGWVAGHKGFRVMKKVRGVSYDLECIGYEEGKGKYAGKVANLLLRYRNGKTIKAMLGKGWTHEDAERLFNHIQIGIGSPVGKIYKVTALQESSKNGVLRLPKVGEERFDKTQPDF